MNALYLSHALIILFACLGERERKRGYGMEGGGKEKNGERERERDWGEFSKNFSNIFFLSTAKVFQAIRTEED